MMLGHAVKQSVRGGVKRSQAQAPGRQMGTVGLGRLMNSAAGPILDAEKARSLGRRTRAAKPAYLPTSWVFADGPGACCRIEEKKMWFLRSAYLAWVGPWEAVSRGPVFCFLFHPCFGVSAESEQTCFSSIR